MDTVAVCIGATKRLLTVNGFWVCMVQEILTKRTSIFRTFFTIINPFLLFHAVWHSSKAYY